MKIIVDVVLSILKYIRCAFGFHRWDIQRVRNIERRKCADCPKQMRVIIGE